MTENLIIRVPKQPDAVIPLTGDPLVIGSDPTSHIAISDPAILPHHAYLSKEDGHWNVATYDAAGPINVDDQPRASLKMDYGSHFTIGKTRFELSNGGAASEAHAAPEASVVPAPRVKAAETPVAVPRVAAAAATPTASATPKAVSVPKVAAVAVTPKAAPQEDVIIENPEAAVAQLGDAIKRIKAEMARIVIGQSEVVNQVLTALFGRGHVLLVGTPGLAKTLMARTLSDALELECKRVQFTPDLMPADITGTQVLEQDPVTQARAFKFKQGPIFTNLLLADEINRTPPKTQAALLEAMQERRVTISGTSYELPSPFFVIATQNPIEQEGTYPLPEAQLDRFMFSVRVSYPTAEEEESIIMATTQDTVTTVDRVLSASALMAFQTLVRKTPVSRHVAAYVTRLVRATRPDQPDAPEFIKNWVRWGAGPRAGQYLILAAKSNALLQGRLNVSCDDVRAFVMPVLRHRVLCNFAAASEGVDSDGVVKKLVEAIPEPDYAKGH
jgi:MoxR-like ATPase